MKSTSALISSETGLVRMVRLVAEIPGGDGSQKCGRARNPCFISTCPAPSQNPRTQVFRDCVFFALAREIACISGHSTVGRCRRANQQLLRSIPPSGATASPAMAETFISRTPMPPPNGCAGAIRMAALNLHCELEKATLEEQNVAMHRESGKLYQDRLYGTKPRVISAEQSTGAPKTRLFLSVKPR